MHTQLNIPGNLTQLAAHFTVNMILATSRISRCSCRCCLDLAGRQSASVRLLTKTDLGAKEEETSHNKPLPFRDYSQASILRTKNSQAKQGQIEISRIPGWIEQVPLS